MSGSGTKKRILLVEDETDIRELMSIHLGREGYELVEVADGDAGMKEISRPHDLIVLDWMLPGTSGVDIARAIRKTNPKVPVLMVTARVEPADVVLGLEAGADDYITKPFEIPVFLARVRALLRRAAIPASASPEVQSIGGLTLDGVKYEVTCDGAPIQLTHSEFKLLSALMKNQGRVLTRKSLIDLVQGSDVSVVDRTIDTHVFGLRKKLGRFGDIIETIRGVGYRVKAGI